VGFDGTKKIKGRKRHIVVDVEGNLLTVKVHASNQHDTKSGSAVLEQTLKNYPTIQAFSADAGYRKSCENFCNQELNRPLHISVRIKDEFAIMPKRWIVERTFAWLGNFRRLCKDFEKLITHAQDMIRIAMIRLTLNRLL